MFINPILLYTPTRAGQLLVHSQAGVPPGCSLVGNPVHKSCMGKTCDLFADRA
eukprot:SAG25_NODE_215_length_11684_cov_261.443677_11_plen_53_part_00